MPTLTLTTEQLISLQRKCEQQNCAGPNMVWFEEFMGYRITPYHQEEYWGDKPWWINQWLIHFPNDEEAIAFKLKWL